MKDKNNPGNWSEALQNDCINLVKDNLGIVIKKEDVNICSPNLGKVFPLIVEAMKL